MIDLSLFRVAFFRLLLLSQLLAFARPVDNFADVNSIIGDVIVKLPEVPTMESGGYSIDLTDVICRNFSILDVSLTSRSVGIVRDSLSGVQIEWSIEGLAFECDAAYRYKGLLGVSNSGDVYLNSRGNQATATATVSAPLTGSPQPPTMVFMDSCTPEVEIVDIDFDNGGFIGWILDAIEGLLRSTMENIASEKICEELQTFLEVNTKGLLEYIASESVLEPYLPTSTTNAAVGVDSLQYEDSFIQKLMPNRSSSATAEISTATSTSTITELLNLQEQKTPTGRWINGLIRKGVSASNEMKATLSNGVVIEELQINQWLRDFVLEDGTGALVLTSSSSSSNGLPGDGILYDNEDLVTHTTIILGRVKLLGLDTLTKFSPLEAIGKYTLGTSLAWRYLALEVDVTMTVRPSTRLDSVIETTDYSSAREIVEEVQMVLEVDGLITGSSLMIALNQTALENSIELGSILKSTKAAADCFLSTILDLEFATFSLEVTNDILTPSIQGLISPGLDRLVSEGMGVFFLLYEEILLEAAPIYFQEELRPMFTQKILHDYILLHNQSNGDNVYARGKNSRECLPWRTSESDIWDDSKTIDFRDLLLPAEEAVALGGSGLARYGDLFSFMFVPYINDELLDINELNAQLIPSVTKEQSGKEGVLEFQNTFQYFNTSSSPRLYETIDFRIVKIMISNLDTVEGPLELLQPVNSSNVLRSRFALNTVTDPLKNDLRFLNITFRMYLEINGDESPFQMKNELDFSLSIPSTIFSIEILANVKEKSFLQFPLKNIANPYCWLATLGVSPENSKEIKAESNEDLTISSLSLFISTFYMASTCISATSPGCDSISEVIDHLEDAGLALSFRDFIISAVMNIAISVWDAFDITGMIKESPKHCPHSEFYDSRAIVSPPEIPVLSSISRNTTETMIALSIIGLQTGIIVSAKNHILLNSKLPTTENESMVASADWIPIPEGRGIVDWTNLTDQSIILLDKFRASLSRGINLSIEDSNITRKLKPETMPRVNKMLRDYILDDSGYLELKLEDHSFALHGISFSLSKIRIGGLDTVIGIEPLVVVDPYKMHTSLQIAEMTMVVECEVTTTDDTAIHQVGILYEARDILIDVDTRIALNATKIGQIQVGSLFHSSKVINCILRGIQVFEISQLTLKLGEVRYSVTEGSFSPKLHVEIDKILDSLRDEYQEEILSAVPLVAGSTIRDIMNTLIPGILQSSAMGCPPPPIFQSDGVVDFRDLFLSDLESKKLGGKGSSSYGDFFQILYNMLNKEVMQTGISNNLLETMTEKQSNNTGMINIIGDFHVARSVIQIADFQADFRIEVSDILLQNLDSVGDPLHVFQPVDREANILDNKLSFGVDSKPLTFEGTLTLSIDDGADVNIRNEIDFSFLVEDVTIQASLMLKLLENSISSFPLEDILDMNCWASAIFQVSDDEVILDGLQLLDQVYSTGDFKMEISCKSCTSPDFDQLLLSLYKPNDVTAAIQEHMSSIMNSGYVQRFVKKFLIEAKKRCPHHPEFDANYEASIRDSIIFSGAQFKSVSWEKKKNPKYFRITNSIIACCLIFIGVLGKLILARRNKKWALSLSNEGQILFRCQQEKQRGIDEWLDEHTTSLFSSPFIPKSIRWGVPILILVNTGLYIGGHFGLLSVVNLDITFAGESFTIDEFLKFQFLESTKKTYDNGGAEMIILLWICTGIWPYIKLALSLAIWMTPPKYLSVKRRRTLLLWIDALARLSIIDIFTLIIGFAILLVFIGGRDMSMNEERSIKEEGIYYALKAIVVPKAGCYCIIIAQRMSRVSSQFFLEYHEKVIEKATLIRKNKEGDMSISHMLIEDQPRRSSSFQLESSSRHVRNTSNSNCDNSQTDLETADQLSRIPTDLSFFTMTSWKAYRWGHLGAIFAGITILIVFVIGLVFVPAIAFDVSTIGGITLGSELTYEEVVSEYGVFLVMSGILLKARFVLKTKADYIGLGLLLLAAGISVAFIFIIKSYHFIQQKMQDRRVKRNGLDEKPSYGHKGCGLPSYFRLYKWNHMEIYFISLCIGVWQLGSIVSYSIHLYCSILGNIFEILKSIGIIEPTEAQCNRVQASLVGNLVIAIGSSVILLVVFFLQAWGQYKKNLIHSSKYVDDKDIPTMSLAWSEDKSKNTRYSHLAQTLFLSASDSKIMSTRAGGTSITKPSESSLPQTGISLHHSHSRSLFTTSSARSNNTIQLGPSHDTIGKDPKGD